MTTKLPDDFFAFAPWPLQPYSNEIDDMIASLEQDIRDTCAQCALPCYEHPAEDGWSIFVVSRSTNLVLRLALADKIHFIDLTARCTLP